MKFKIQKNSAPIPIEDDVDDVDDTPKQEVVEKRVSKFKIQSKQSQQTEEKKPKKKRGKPDITNPLRKKVYDLIEENGGLTSCSNKLKVSEYRIKKLYLELPDYQTAKNFLNLVDLRRTEFWDDDEWATIKSRTGKPGRPATDSKSKDVSPEKRLVQQELKFKKQSA